MRSLLARFVALLHTALVAFVCVAWAFPWTWAIWSVLILYPLIQINWWWFGGRCGLTVLEERLRGPERVRRSADAQQPLNFVAELGSRLLGRPVPHRWADLASYGVLWGGFASAVLRLCLRQTA